MQRFARVQIVMVARDDIQIARLESFRRPLALPFERPHLHRQTVLFHEAAFFHHLPERHVARRPVINSNFFPSHNSSAFLFSLRSCSDGLNDLNHLNGLNGYFPLSVCQTFWRYSCRPVTIQFQSVSSKYFTPFFGKLPEFRFDSSTSVRRLTEP